MIRVGTKIYPNTAKDKVEEIISPDEPDQKIEVSDPKPKTSKKK